MERTSYLLQIIIDYMFNNNLSIDKATFFTVIIGQITIYGILLTFYQFVASYQGGEKAATRYLGINITEYFVKKKIKIFNKIISKKMFGVLLILEILYKPFMTIYGETLGTSTISIINFVWFLFAIVYFILFVMLFIQCTKSILMIKMSSDIKRNGYIISEINKEFLKKTMKERISKNAIDLLRRDFVNLHDAIQEDENTELQGRYNQLIHLIFTDYIGRKQYEISNIEKKGRILKNQVSWIYNSNCEVHLLQEIIDEIYFQLDEQNIKSILNFYIDLIRLNLIRAKQAGYDELMECESIHTWVQYMRYNSFAMQNSFPRKLNITLRSLLLTNINVVIVVNYVHENRYFYDDVIGAYLLVKLHELSDKTQKQKQIKEIVKNAFIASNMDIDEYINMIEKECYMCRCEINYVQKEKMKEYLLQTF